MRASVLIRCLVDQFHSRVGENVVRVLKKIGVQVHYTDKQLCCSQHFFTAGHLTKTLPLAKRTIQVFRHAEIVVAPSGSCVNMIQNHYLELFHHDSVWLEQAQELWKKIYEFSEFLIHVVQVEDLGATFRGKATHHDSCQGLRGLGVSSEPRQLLRKVKGLELVEMESKIGRKNFI